MTIRSRLLTGCAIAWATTAALPALAQTVTEPPPPEVIVVVEPAPTPTPEPVIVVTDPNAGRFAALPTGERKIAQSLYDAQFGTTPVMTRDDIAAARGTQGWGQVFRSMQADGLVQQRNLGQVVSGSHHTAGHHTAGHHTAGHHAAAVTATPVTVSYGNGATTGGTVAVKSTGHSRHTATTTVTTASGGAGAGILTTHGNSHGHAATVAASTTTSAGGGAAGRHGGGGGGGGGAGHGKR
ncbi:MAG: hypothetical protein H7Y60_10750 [Rhodospirillaceae bacterium]|nr:hypothetical protein [Rhodospirillales bacterium]